MINLFGEEQPLSQATTRKRPKAANKLSDPNPMVIQCGKKVPETRCKHCKHLYRKQWNKTYYKCSFRKDTNGPATDHRYNWPACAKFECDRPQR